MTYGEITKIIADEMGMQRMSAQAVGGVEREIAEIGKM